MLDEFIEFLKKESIIFETPESEKNFHEAAEDITNYFYSFLSAFDDGRNRFIKLEQVSTKTKLGYAFPIECKYRSINNDDKICNFSANIYLEKLDIPIDKITYDDLSFKCVLYSQSFGGDIHIKCLSLQNAILRKDIENIYKRRASIVHEISHILFKDELVKKGKPNPTKWAKSDGFNDDLESNGYLNSILDWLDNEIVQDLKNNNPKVLFKNENDIIEYLKHKNILLPHEEHKNIVQSNQNREFFNDAFAHMTQQKYQKIVTKLFKHLKHIFDIKKENRATYWLMKNKLQEQNLNGIVSLICKLNEQ